MATAPPQLGYGQRTEAPINAVNQYMRATPWYQALLKSFGQNPNDVHLTDNQKQQVIRAAQANGIVVDEGHDGQEVDDSGNFQAKGHGLRNTLLVGGIAGAALLTMGAAGVFSGAAAGAGAGGAAGGGAAAAGAGGTLGSTVIGSGFAPGIVGGSGVAGAAGATGTGVAGGGFLAGAGHFLSSPAGASIAGTAGNIFSNIYGANKQADANARAAELADEATKRAEAFSREQAETGWQSNEHTQKANYDQWRARQDAIMGSLGQQLGIHYAAPEYSAGIDPHYTGVGGPAAAPGAPATSTAAPSGIDWNAPAPQLGARLSAYYKSRGVSDQEVPYWVGKAPELVARGKEINNPNYANERLAASDVFGGRQAAPSAPRQTLATFVSPQFRPYQTTTALPTPYQPGTLGAYFGRG